LWRRTRKSVAAFHGFGVPSCVPAGNSRKISVSDMPRRQSGYSAMLGMLRNTAWRRPVDVRTLKMETTMSDFRDPNDPTWRNAAYDPNARGYSSTWGWVIGALFVLVVLVIAFGTKHEPNQTASNDVSPPAATRMAPPPSGLTPSPANPAQPPAAVNPTPTEPKPPSNQ
jgi:hypothetical protein